MGSNFGLSQTHEDNNELFYHDAQSKKQNMCKFKMQKRLYSLRYCIVTDRRASDQTHRLSIVNATKRQKYTVAMIRQ